MSLFGFVKTRQFRRNKFKLGYNSKLSIKPGFLYPFYLEHCYPNDTFNIGNNVLFRLAPMMAPIMQDLDVYTHYFFVPYRLIWDDWKRFITKGVDGNINVSYPQINGVPVSVLETGTLADYLRFPDPFLTGSTSGDVCNGLDALPFRAYQLIWNEYYRDQNLEKPRAFGRSYSGNINYSTTDEFTDDSDETADGTISTPISDMFELRMRSWYKDYFTSALPFAQRGEEVELPLLGDGSLSFKDGSYKFLDVNLRNGRVLGGSPVTETTHFGLGFDVEPFGSGHGADGYKGKITTDEGRSAQVDGMVDMTSFLDRVNVDLSGVSSATINELRRAFAAQEYLESMARGGSRYIEQMLSIFGQRSSDARLQRPQFLGGGRSPIVISDILQTSQSTETSAQASPSGHGVGVQRVNNIHYHCEEHGFIMGIMSVMPKASYFQGMPRQFMFRDPLEFYNPYFAHLGEQEIKSGELYYDYQDGDYNDSLFGYTPRYAEMKTRLDEIHGDFRTNLEFWHMARHFEKRPALNEDFLHNFSSVDRVFNVVNDNVDKFWVHVENFVSAKRLMPKYGTPRLL